MQPVPPPATACGRDAQRPRRGALADAAAAAGLAPRLLPGRDGPGHREELGSRAAAALSGHGACSRDPAPGAPPPPAASARWVRTRAGGARAGRGGARRRQAPGTTAPARAERAEPRDPKLPQRGALQLGPLPPSAWEPVASFGFPPWDGRLCPFPGQPGRSLGLPPARSSPVRLQGGALLGPRGRRVSREKTARGRRAVGGADGR